MKKSPRKAANSLETAGYWEPKPEDAWIADFKRDYNGFDPVGFKRWIDRKKFLIAPKSGAGLVSLEPNRQQRQLIDKIVENRKARRPTRIILIKPRQGMGASTGVGAIFSGEAFANRAWSATVSAMQPETIDAIWDTYRLMFASAQGQILEGGGYKDEWEKRRGARDNRRQLRVPDTLSAINIANASTKRGANLGRGTAPKAWHASEADYYPDFKRALESIMPALPDTPISIAILETTPNMDASTYFKDFVRRNVERRSNTEASHEGLWDVWFVPWFEVDYFRRPPPPTAATEPQLSEAEKLLVKLGASPENLAWRRYALNNQFAGDERAFTEAYPATLAEALSVWGVGEFFFSDATDFYRKNTIKPPRSFWLLDAQSRLEPRRELTDPRDLDFYPHHTRVWTTPVSGRRYIIGADCADSENRKSTHGSHSAAVVWDAQTGEQMAEIDADCPTHLFTFALAELGRWYNNAELAPENSPYGSSVITVLNSILNYAPLYRMEESNGVMLTVTDSYGYKTTSRTRHDMIDALRYAYNTRRLIIRSERLLGQILECGARGFSKLETHDKERGLLDDLAIAAAIGCVVHGNAYNVWQPHTAEALVREEPKTQKVQKTLEMQSRIRYNSGARLSPDEFDTATADEARVRRLLNRT